ncbi:MAG: hypothetical protein AAFR42_17860, partial [Cyanobacteria bacterium J06628_6]
MSKVLVLNASYEPLNITSWRRAVVLVLKGKAEQVEHNGRVIYSNFPLPTVIRLRHYVRVPYKEIPLTRPLCSTCSALPLMTSTTAR